MCTDRLTVARDTGSRPWPSHEALASEVIIVPLLQDLRSSWKLVQLNMEKTGSARGQSEVNITLQLMLTRRSDPGRYAHCL